MLSLLLFNLYAEYIIQDAGLDKSQTGISYKYYMYPLPLELPPTTSSHSSRSSQSPELSSLSSDISFPLAFYFTHGSVHTLVAKFLQIIVNVNIMLFGFELTHGDGLKNQVVL